VTIDRHWQSVSVAATDLIREVAVIHMLCAASVEAHINIRAEEALNGKNWDEFDKLALAGKWLFYPSLVSKQSFDPGQQPFQGLQTLVKRRNALMHYKVKRAKVRHGYILPPLLDQLGLRVTHAKESIETVKKLVSKLASLEQREARMAGEQGLVCARHRDLNTAAVVQFTHDRAANSSSLNSTHSPCVFAVD
jgi:hypothetical protein